MKPSDEQVRAARELVASMTPQERIAELEKALYVCTVDGQGHVLDIEQEAARLLCRDALWLLRVAKAAVAVDAEAPHILDADTGRGPFGTDFAHALMVLRAAVDDAQGREGA